MSNINYKEGIFQETIKDGGKVEKLVTPINLRAFYNELHDTLVKNKFKDMLNDPDGDFLNNQAKAGEFVDNKANLNRTGDMFEIKFFLMKKEGVSEIEIQWKARKNSIITDYGWYEFKFDLVCRNMKDIDILEGNKKITLQSGGWEFRNEIVYKNNMIKKYLHKIPIVKNSPYLQKVYFEHIYMDKIEHDIIFGEKILKIIYKVIDKHFKTNIVS